MSLAGEKAHSDVLLASGRKLWEEKDKVFREMLRHGMIHGDLQEEKILDNLDTDHVMLIDMEHAEILVEVPVAQETSSNRKRKITWLETKNVVRHRRDDGL